MLAGHQARRLMRIVADLMQRDQLIGKGIGIILVDVLVGEANGIVEIGTLRHRMVAQRVQMRRHRVDRRKGRVAGGLRYRCCIVWPHSAGRGCCGLERILADLLM